MAAGSAEAAAWTITRLFCRIDIPKPLFGRRKNEVPRQPARRSSTGTGPGLARGLLKSGSFRLLAVSESLKRLGKFA
jgi:hypothetical protein